MTALKIAPELALIGNVFALLQEKRHLADYGPPMVLFSRTEALTLLLQAREAIALIRALDAEARIRVALLLVVSKQAS